MIISHKYKFIFVHIPRTGGTAITCTLVKLCGRENIRSISSNKHVLARDIKRIVGTNIWRDYFTFSFVRNPWDIMVSSYFWWLQKSGKLKGLSKIHKAIGQMRDFREFISSEYGLERINELKGNICDWITDRNGKVIVDFIGRSENLNDDFKKVCKRIGIVYKPLLYRNLSARRHYSFYYDDNTIEIVRKRFCKEIDMFGYKFGSLDLSGEKPTR